MIEKIFQIRQDFLDNIDHLPEFEEHIDTLHYLSMPRSFDIDTFFPPVFEREDYYEKVQNYSSEEFSKLKKFAENKANSITVERENKPNLLIVHPFYPFFRHLNLCAQSPTNYQEDLMRYYSRITELIKSPLFDKTLIDTVDSFLLAYSLWERYPPNEVRFTFHNKGTLLDNSPLTVEEPYIAGCYVDKCIDDVIAQMDTKYTLIKDAMIKRPLD